MDYLHLINSNTDLEPSGASRMPGPGRCSHPSPPAQAWPLQGWGTCMAGGGTPCAPQAVLGKPFPERSAPCGWGCAWTGLPRVPERRWGNHAHGPPRSRVGGAEGRRPSHGPLGGSGWRGWARSSSKTRLEPGGGGGPWLWLVGRAGLGSGARARGADLSSPTLGSRHLDSPTAWSRQAPRSESSL